ncbi:MAG: 5'-methylthioadenosine/S-adenosylhomocysteine nucleosidase [bacterium]|nr:5'-methylthioadenosine/S-adenosylhomocysteine nucleosidase [bacterium]
MNQTVVVVVSHAYEARAMARVGRAISKEPWGQWTLYRGEMWDLPLAVIRCGPGKTAAAAAAQAAVQYLDPTLMLSFGTAGCPDREVELGTLTVASTVIDMALIDPADLPVSPPARFLPDEEILACLNRVPGTSPATFFCWEGRLASPLILPELKDVAKGLMVVDWESAAVAQVSEIWGIPWAALKVVSDHGEPQRLKMLAVVAKRHLEWGAEAVRRACHRYCRSRLDTQGVDEGEEGQR